MNTSCETTLHYHRYPNVEVMQHWQFWNFPSRLRTFKRTELQLCLFSAVASSTNQAGIQNVLFWNVPSIDMVVLFIQSVFILLYVIAKDKKLATVWITFPAIFVVQVKKIMLYLKSTLVRWWRPKLV